MDETTNTTVGAVMAVLSIIAVVTRFYVRSNKKAGLEWDDWLIVVSLLTMIATDILAICGSFFSSFHHPPLESVGHSECILTSLLAITGNPDGPKTATVATDTHEYGPEDVLYTKLSWSTTMIYFTITSSTKLSILLMYNRLFSVDELFRRLIMALSGLVLCYWMGCTIANLANCVPMKYVWINSLSDPRYCFNYNIYWFSSGICETLIDILVLLLPIKAIFGLQLGIKQKLAIGSVFLLGAL